MALYKICVLWSPLAEFHSDVHWSTAATFQTVQLVWKYIPIFYLQILTQGSNLSCKFFPSLPSNKMLTSPRKLWTSTSSKIGSHTPALAQPFSIPATHSRFASLGNNHLTILIFMTIQFHRHSHPIIALRIHGVSISIPFKHPSYLDWHTCPPTFLCIILVPVGW